MANDTNPKPGQADQKPDDDSEKNDNKGNGTATGENNFAQDPHFNNYLELAKITQADFANRRNLEWKLSLGLWGGVVAFTYTTLNVEAMRSWCVVILSFIGFACIMVGHWFVIKLIARSHARDKLLYWWYRTRAEGSSTKRPYPVDVNPFEIDPKTKKPRVDLLSQIHWDHWFQFHMGVSALILLSSWALLIVATATEDAADKKTGAHTASVSTGSSVFSFITIESRLPPEK